MADIGRIPSPSPLPPVEPGKRIKDRGERDKRRRREQRDDDKHDRPGDKGDHQIDEYA